ncbi:hypothetical protein [Halosimplex halobium]|uniref:hypothetical protein n=1 Tax=Halosimplex halobium TaxID=3396618 RepID=UPI003F571C4F
MSVRDSLRRGRRFLLGDYQSQVAAGAATTVALFLLGAVVVWPARSVGITGVIASAVGGTVTGVALGRNWLRGAAVGARAVVVGFAVLGVVVPVGLFLSLRAQTGQHFFYVSPLLGGVLLLVSPVCALVGGVAGALGAQVRRAVVPSEYNPPVY